MNATVITDAVASGQVLSVDLGGTNMRAAVVDADGRILERGVAPTPPGCAVRRRARRPDGLDA